MPPRAVLRLHGEFDDGDPFGVVGAARLVGTSRLSRHPGNGCRIIDRDQPPLVIEHPHRVSIGIDSHHTVPAVMAQRRIRGADKDQSLVSADAATAFGTDAFNGQCPVPGTLAPEHLVSGGDPAPVAVGVDLAGPLVFRWLDRQRQQILDDSWWCRPRINVQQDRIRPIHHPHVGSVDGDRAGDELHVGGRYVVEVQVE
ncbi:hypothetical protein [Rhodococcus sp. JVH1]|uniref:hypothetical protein n=1 Tax=Rhodococcus sp. JVH1 TaxID=745408 RepID=UPI0005C24526